MTSELLLVAIVPHEPTLSAISKLQKEFCARVDSLKGMQLPPHISLTPPFETSFGDELVKKLGDLAKHHNAISVELTGLSHFTHHPTLYYAITPNAAISKLHDEVIELVRTIRNPAFTAYYRQPSGRAGELLKLYGSEYVKEKFAPHMSLTRSDSDKEKFRALIAEKPEAPALTFIASDVIVLLHTPEGWIERARVPLKH